MEVELGHKDGTVKDMRIVGIRNLGEMYQSTHMDSKNPLFGHKGLVELDLLVEQDKDLLELVNGSMLRELQMLGEKLDYLN